MGYIFLSAALLAGITKAYCGKKTSGALACDSDSMIINVLRMFLCVCIGFFLVALNSELSLLSIDAFQLFVYALSGVASALFVVSWLLSVRSGAYMMVEIFLLLGVIVPVVLCRIFFHETVTLWQIGGCIILLIAIYIMCTYNTSVKGKMSLKAFLLLLLCGLSNGIADFSQKLFVKTYADGSVAIFNFYTYIFACITLAVSYLVFRKVDASNGVKIRKPLEVLKPIWYFVLIMSVCLFLNSFFKTLAAQELDAVVLYPLNQGCAVLLSLLMSSVIFKEKINARCVVGVCLSFIALLLIVLPIA